MRARVRPLDESLHNSENHLLRAVGWVTSEPKLPLGLESRASRHFYEVVGYTPTYSSLKSLRNDCSQYLPRYLLGTTLGLKML